jgi:molybdate transport system substrate-binding protein
MPYSASHETPTDIILSRRGFLAAAAAAGAVASSAHAQSSGPGPATSGGLKVLSAGSTLYGMRPAADAFTRGASIPVAVTTDHGHNIEKFALAGTADADVVVIPTEMMSKLIKAERADKSTLVEIGAVRIGSAVHDKAPRPDVSRIDTLRAAVLAAKEVLLTNAPTGDHLAQVFVRIGVGDEVKPKIKRFDTATLLNKYIAEHPDAGALGFGPTTEILTWRGKGVTMAGTLPDAIQIVLPYQAGMLTRTPSPDGARKLLAFLAMPPARKHFHDSGVE